MVSKLPDLGSMDVSQASAESSTLKVRLGKENFSITLP
jgi:hypothetical protein